MKTHLSSNWKPKMGPFDIRARFPLLDPEGTVLAFVAYHLEKADTSNNWDATFYGWCDYRQRQAAQLQSNDKVTDSMGFPLRQGGSTLTGGEGDYGRRFLAVYMKNTDLGMSPDEARVAAERELETPDGE